MRTKAFLAVPAAAALALVPALPAAASSSAESYEITLDQLNDSGATGTAVLTLEGTQLTVMVEASGLAPELPHAQHIHGLTDGSMDFVCPDISADADGDGIVNTAEGIPMYGDINISLTTEGDTTADSGLAVDRFPVADAEGNLGYERTIEVSQDVVDHIQDLHVVQHGVDFDDSGAYDGDAPSSLDPSLPLEATVPANCGMVVGSSVGTVPGGGVETGVGSTEGNENLALLGIGGAALVAAAGIGAVASRRRSTGPAAQDS